MEAESGSRRGLRKVPEEQAEKEQLEGWEKPEEGAT